jgi:hypothetical protein
MTKKKQTRIIELHLNRSKKNPKLCHVVALLFPCNHKKYLGITKTPEGMEGNFRRAESAKVWYPSHYQVTDREGCFACPEESFWIHELPKLEELKEIEEDID